MIKEIYKLFRETMPEVIRDKATVKRILGDKDNHIISHEAEGKLVGVSVINGNVIYLLCVDKSYQNQGIGSSLLAKSEAYVIEKGYNDIVIGAGKAYITPGIPKPSGHYRFFEKRGFFHAWNEKDCFDMEMKLADFIDDGHNLGDIVDGICYRFAKPADMDAVRECIADAEDFFVKYYMNEELYHPDTGQRALIALRGDEVVGALMVYAATDDAVKGSGAVGCTATKTKYRGQGIATMMVRLGTKHLWESGIESSFVGYTYTDIMSVYGKSGYQVSMEYFMAKKELSRETV
ncbi:MAG: GNAT family N-acetyltransferase [Lachnospiraceae bacterium]|jgi:ribosomal protein S18 acetylase RimI-like enzyme|nr:GNAT family N-acetyltransferase [Lachnospiraceae bacterium]